MLYDVRKYPYKYLPIVNSTPLLVKTLFNIFTNLFATIVITAVLISPLYILEIEFYTNPFNINERI